MFGGNNRDQTGTKDQQRSAFVQNALTASSLISIALMILIAPDFYHVTSDFVWDFLSARYPAQIVGLAFVCVYLAAYPAMYFLARASWTTSAGIALLWIADKIV